MSDFSLIDAIESGIVKIPRVPVGDVTLIVEVTGEGRKDKAAKVAAARNLWIPAVNNHGGFGRWAFVEVTDPWDALATIRAAVSEALARA